MVCGEPDLGNRLEGNPPFGVSRPLLVCELLIYGDDESVRMARQPLGIPAGVADKHSEHLVILPYGSRGHHGMRIEMPGAGGPMSGYLSGDGATSMAGVDPIPASPWPLGSARLA